VSQNPFTLLEGGLQAMATAPKTVRVTTETALPDLLDDAAWEPMILERDGVRFRVIRAEEDLWADYDPEAVLEGLREITGTLSADEGERMKALIYRGREEGTRPITHP
jgi:hypothetical protein